MKYSGGVIINFENVSNERRLDLKCFKVKSKMLFSVHPSFIINFDYDHNFLLQFLLLLIYHIIFTYEMKHYKNDLEFQ